MVKNPTPQSVLNWEPDPNQQVESVESSGVVPADQTDVTSSPAQPGPPSPIPSDSGSPAQPGPSTVFSVPSAPKKKKKKQLSHEEILREYDGPARTDECIKKSIDYFSTCTNLI